MELISKKDLLKDTGISYGQLYRWKREKLIPEEWFMKQSAFTGQETFFPREKVLKRVEAIQNLKDDHSLEELAHLLSPELTDRMFKLEDALSMPELDRETTESYASVLNKKTLTYIDVIFIYALSILKREAGMGNEQVGDMIRGFSNEWFDEMKGTGYYFTVYKMNSQQYIAVHQLQARMLMDARFEMVRQFHMDELSDELQIKYGRRIL